MTVTLITVIIITIASYFLYKQIHQYRYILYIINTVLALSLSHETANYITFGFIALSFFVVVMYTGVLEKGVLRKRLSMVRAELAVLGTIYLIPHALAYTGLVLDDIGIFNGPLTYYIGLLTGIVIAPLAVTSLTFVRKQFTYKQWKKLHQLAYLVYGLLALHLIIQQTERMWLYILLFGFYTVLKGYMLLKPYFNQFKTQKQ